jgi:chromosome segregation ATPase
MTEGMNEINRTIGRLQASIENLTKTLGEQDREATEGRRELHRKIEELKNKVVRIATELQKLSEDFTKMEPSIVRFEQRRQRSIGERGVINVVIKLVWGALIAGIGAVSYVISDFIHILWPPRH